MSDDDLDVFDDDFGIGESVSDDFSDTFEEPDYFQGEDVSDFDLPDITPVDASDFDVGDSAPEYVPVSDPDIGSSVPYSPAINQPDLSGLDSVDTPDFTTGTTAVDTGLDADTGLDISEQTKAFNTAFGEQLLALSSGDMKVSEQFKMSLNTHLTLDENGNIKADSYFNPLDPSLRMDPNSEEFKSNLDVALENVTTIGQAMGKSDADIAKMKLDVEADHYNDIAKMASTTTPGKPEFKWSDPTSWNQMTVQLVIALGTTLAQYFINKDNLDAQIDIYKAKTDIDLYAKRRAKEIDQEFADSGSGGGSGSKGASRSAKNAFTA